MGDRSCDVGLMGVKVVFFLVVKGGGSGHCVYYGAGECWVRGSEC